MIGPLLMRDEGDGLHDTHLGRVRVVTTAIELGDSGQALLIDYDVHLFVPHESSGSSLANTIAAIIRAARSSASRLSSALVIARLCICSQDIVRRHPFLGAPFARKTPQRLQAYRPIRLDILQCGELKRVHVYSSRLSPQPPAERNADRH